MNSYTKDNLQKNFIKPLITAAVGGFLTAQEPANVIGTFTFRPELGGASLSPMQYGALVGFASSFIVESLNNVVHSIDRKNRTTNYVSFLTHSFGSMAVWAFLPDLLSGGTAPSQTKMALAKIGFISELGGQFLHESFVESNIIGDVFG